jgi:menaquinone-dependent protoporphyrinogen IX oxidase
MKTNIIYYTFTGNNGKLVEKLQQKLACDIYNIQELKERKMTTILFDVLFKRGAKIKTGEVNWKDYDQIIFVAPIWDKGIAAPMKSFLKREKEQFANYSFATICTGRPGQQEKLIKQLQNYTGKKPHKVVQFLINDLLPEEKKGKVKYTSTYRISEKDFNVFQGKFDNFINNLKM